MDECRAILDDDYDIDSVLAYYLFVNHGILPHNVLNMDTREKALVLAMSQKEIKNRPSGK
jgi:hypothetical protein